MSFRMPQNLSSGLMPEPGPSAFEREVMAEKAASLGRAGRALEARLDALAAAPRDEGRAALVQSAADAAYAYFVQRELCGLVDRRQAIEDFGISRDVLARIGARPRSA